MKRLNRWLTDTFRVPDFQGDLREARSRKVTALTDFDLGLARLYRAVGTNRERFNLVTEINFKEISYAQ